MRIFQKTLLTNAPVLLAGKPIPFQSFSGSNTGAIVLDEKLPEHQPLIDALERTCGKRGISEISEAEYKELEKKTDWPTPRRRSSINPLAAVRLAPNGEKTLKTSQDGDAEAAAVNAAQGVIVEAPKPTVIAPTELATPSQVANDLVARMLSKTRTPRVAKVPGNMPQS